MVAPKFCRVCGKPPLVICALVQGPGFGVMNGVSKGRPYKHKFVVACVRKCVPDAVHGCRENAVWEWNEAIRNTGGVKSYV